MNIMNYFIIGSFLIISSILLSSFSSRLGIPILFIFLSIGMLAGIDGIGKIDFNDYSVAYTVSNLALAVILLDGGIKTKRKTFQLALFPALSLSTIGVIITSGLTGIVASWIFNLNIIEGILIGSIVGSTDASAVFSLLGNTNLKEHVNATLEIESGSNDPMSMFLTTTLISILQNKNNEFYFDLMFFFNLIYEFGIGIIIGITGGWILYKIINRIVLVSSLYPLLALSGGIMAFSISNLLHASGILSIYLYGFMLGNHPIRNRFEILKIFDGMTWLSQICMFLILGLLVTPSDLLDISIPAFILSFWIIFIARPLSVLFGLLPFHKRYNKLEFIFLSWVGLRGAVPIILAVFPIISGLENSRLYFNVSFFIVLISLLIQGTSINFIAKLTKVTTPSSFNPTSRSEISLSIESSWEKLVYKIKNNSKISGKFINNIKLPEFSYIVALFRKDIFVKINPLTKIFSGDVIVIFIKKQDISKLGKIFDK
ncbi:b1191 [Wigglesworthia glossinidia endosymbiont of Glossina brevipalpis]|uniref:B1191 protein n=1 Tax=Wigglesworthia glossinidia brevipalpis TaxID=36870 RepID=Q8D2H7_WIGBR|nr:b1191 [Wigglesworthia glossinidia endosymbiont of Glossina brevipalpis]